MLRATTWTHGRRGATAGASAAVVCLGAVLVACGAGGSGEGYVAVGAPGGMSAGVVAPTGGVTLVPLDEAMAEERGSEDPKSPAQRVTSPPHAPSATPRELPKSGRTPTTSPPPPSPTRTTASPAALSWSAPKREAADERWCEKVTLVFDNSGGSPVRSGTVTFGTHIIGALGVDWGTVESTEELPAPIESGARKEKTWTVCVDAWRVPLGMHVETRDVSVQWE
ncbi:hypothetical protein AB0I00_28325 [Streptomyces sp. NPDC050803]|uniref:hypothetical protein n=1 Tax=unclassified Streptomyces TaxID=2593676 RepID=UPI0034462CE2